VRRLLIGLVALLMGALESVAAQGLPVLNLQAASGAVPTLGYLERHIDATGRVQLPEVRQLAFSPIGGLSSGGFGTAAHWYRFRVQRPHGVPEAWVLGMGEPYLDDVRVWILAAGRPIQEFRLGDHVPFEQRPLPTPQHALALTLPADTPVEIYVRVQSISALNFNATLWQSEAFSRHESQINFFQGLYFGLMLLIVLINVMSGLWLRDGSMLSFAVYVLTLLLFFLAIHGYAAVFVGEETPWLSDAVTGLGVIGSIGAAVYTWSRLLGLGEHYPRIHLAYRWFAVLCLVLLIFSTSPAYSFIAPRLFLVSLIFMAMTLALVFMIWRRTRNAEFGFYGLAILCNVAGGAVQIGLPMGWLPVNIVTDYAHQALSLVQAILMSLGLALRLAKMRDERQRMEQDMRLVDQRASEQRRFVALLSHEFRNPLALIDRSAQMVLHSAPNLPVAASQRVHNIRSGVSMLATLVDSFLSTEAMQQASLPVKRAPTDLHDFLDAELASLGPEAQDRVELAVEAGLLDWPFDRMLMGMAIRNLILNALRYSPVDYPVELSARQSGQELEISVADRGGGLSAQELQQLGQPYYRASGSAGKQGSGLGYHFSLRIVAAHGGRLEASNRLGGGLVVTVRLPSVDSGTS
jgi:signal transduction histidine kinase